MPNIITRVNQFQAADMQMGGHVIAMMHFLHLQAALRNTVTSVEFLDLPNVSCAVVCLIDFSCLIN